jgi:hypothetical protein
LYRSWPTKQPFPQRIGNPTKALGVTLLLKIILAILALIGAVVVLGIAAILMLYFIVARRITRRVRQSLHEFESLQQSAIDADYFRELGGEFKVPPMRIHLKSAPPDIWAGSENWVAEAAQWIESHSFDLVGSFILEERPESQLKVFLSDDQRLVAAIRRDNPAAEAYVEFCFDLGENQRGGVSNPPDATVPLPEDAIGEHFHVGLSEGLHILPKMLQRARELAEEHGALKVQRTEIEEFFEAAHAAEMDARIERGGLTAEEIQVAFDNDQQSASPSEIEEIQWDWQEAIEHFLVEQSAKGAECADENGEVVAVHDGSLSFYLYRRFGDFYETESEIEPEDLQRTLHELETLLRLFKPREAIARFRPLLPESLRFNLVDQLRKPVEADLYLLPSCQ